MNVVQYYLCGCKGMPFHMRMCNNNTYTCYLPWNWCICIHWLNAWSWDAECLMVRIQCIQIQFTDSRTHCHHVKSDVINYEISRPGPGWSPSYPITPLDGLMKSAMKKYWWYLTWTGTLYNQNIISTRSKLKFFSSSVDAINQNNIKITKAIQAAQAKMPMITRINCYFLWFEEKYTFDSMFFLMGFLQCIHDLRAIARNQQE